MSIKRPENHAALERFTWLPNLWKKCNFQISRFWKDKHSLLRLSPERKKPGRDQGGHLSSHYPTRPADKPGSRDRGRGFESQLSHSPAVCSRESCSTSLGSLPLPRGQREVTPSWGRVEPPREAMQAEPSWGPGAQSGSDNWESLLYFLLLLSGKPALTSRMVSLDDTQCGNRTGASGTV